MPEDRPQFCGSNGLLQIMLSEASFPQMNWKLCLRAHLCWLLVLTKLKSTQMSFSVQQDLRAGPKAPDSPEFTPGLPLRHGFLLPAVLPLLAFLTPGSTSLHPRSQSNPQWECKQLHASQLCHGFPWIKLPIFHSFMRSRRDNAASLHNKTRPMSKVISGVTATQWDQVMGTYHLGKAGMS